MTNKKNIIAPLLLLVASLIWGISFVIMKDALDNIGASYLIAIRFSVAALLIFLISFKKWKLINFRLVLTGLLTGLFLGGAYIIQTYGLKLTTPGKNAFITSIYCILVPFLYWIFNKKRPNKYNFISAGIALVGLGLISFKSLIEFRVINIGDILTFICGIFYALHIVFTNKYCQEHDLYLITAFQFLSTAIMAWVIVFAFERSFEPITLNMVPQLLYLIVLASFLALLFQNYGMYNMDPSKGSLILSLEAVFGALTSIIFGYETNVDLVRILGFLLILGAIFISQTQLKFLRKEKAYTT